MKPTWLGVIMIGVSKQPLFHFLLAGGVLFALHAGMNRAPEDAKASKAPQIRVGAADVQWLGETWSRQWRRPPTREELRGLLTDYLNEQLLAREARALGLDDDDVIVRRRLAQKLTFLIEDTLRVAEPSDTELQQFYERHAERFRSEARISFAHVYFNPERRADAYADAMQAMRSLVKAEAPRPARDLGDRLLIGSEFHGETEQGVSGTFGPEFSRAVFSLEPGAWRGPIKSGYGVHIVRVSDVQTSRLPPFSEARMRVAEEWKREQEKSTKERYLAELRRKYDVVLDETARSLLAPTATADGANAKGANP